MQILPSSPLTQYIQAVELNGEAVNATYIDMETGRVQYWYAGEQVEGVGQIRILLQSKDKKASLDPAMASELDKLLEQAKQGMALMTPDQRAEIYSNLKSLLAAVLEE